MRPDAAGTRVPQPWASPAWMLPAAMGLLGLTGLFGLAALLTFDRQDGTVFCPVWVGLILASGLFMVGQRSRSQAAPAGIGRAGDETGELLAVQRTFLQDAAHQLKTPITIALGHAELLASELAGHREQQDIYVVVGELTRLKSLSERLLLIAASQDPEFLRLAPVALDSFLTDALRRWQPTARRVWVIGQLDTVTVPADHERLGLAVDALLENAVQHTGPGDTIRLSVARDDDAASARLVVEDSGEGIMPAEVDHIFERFRTGPARGGPHGTGLGLTLVRAVARGHGGEVRVHSTPGAGSTFELILPVTARPRLTLRIRTGGRPAGQQDAAGTDRNGAAPGLSRPAGVAAPDRPPRGGRWPRPAVVAAVAVCAVALATVIAIDGTSHRNAPVAQPAAPAFTLPSLRDPGQMVSLSAYRGHPVIVNFFASWCGPCQRETPVLASFYRASAGKTVIIGVDADDSVTAARRFVAAEHVGYPTGFESTPAVANAYGVSAVGIPETFFLDSNHRIVKRILGDVTTRELAEETAALNGHPSPPSSAAGPAAGSDGNQNRW